MCAIKKRLTENIVTYEAVIILLILSHSIQPNFTFDFSKFSTLISPWMIFPAAILSLEKLRNMIVWKDFSLIFIHFTAIGFFGSLTMPAMKLCGVSIFAIIVFSTSFLFMKEDVNKPHDLEGYYSERYCHSIVVIFFLYAGIRRYISFLRSKIW